jgi:hypothetical protein
VDACATSPGEPCPRVPAMTPAAVAPTATLIHNSFFDDRGAEGDALTCRIEALATLELKTAVTCISKGPVAPLGTKPRPMARPSESVCVIRTRSDPNAAPGPLKGV